jgi:hypothetical protein
MIAVAPHEVHEPQLKERNPCNSKRCALKTKEVRIDEPDIFPPC